MFSEFKRNQLISCSAVQEGYSSGLSTTTGNSQANADNKDVIFLCDSNTENLNTNISGLCNSSSIQSLQYCYTRICVVTQELQGTEMWEHGTAADLELPSPDPDTDRILRQRFFHLHMKGSKLLFGTWHSTTVTQMLTSRSFGWTGQPKHILPPQHLMVIAFSFFIGKFVGEKKPERPHTAVWQHKQAK